MSVYKINKTFKKGLVLLVGSKGLLGNTIVDGISMHIGYCLGDRIEYIDIAHIRPYDEIIYIVGHGGLKNHTIDGRKMAEVANLLLEAGYRGKQKIYVTSCDAALKSKKDNKSIIDELQRCLEETLMEMDNQLLPLTIESDCKGKSIFIDNSGVTEMWVVDPKTNTKIVYSFNQMPFISLHNLYFKLKAKKYNRNINLSNKFKKKLIKCFGGD